jgi:hypothetical protein
LGDRLRFGEATHHPVKDRVDFAGGFTAWLIFTGGMAIDHGVTESGALC